MRKGNIYKVKWLDHFSETGWKDNTELVEWAKDRNTCVTVGFLSYQDNDIIVIAGSHDGLESYGDFMAIYKNCIISIDTLE